MFLASLLSVFAGAWMFAAAPFTVTMKSAGDSARSDGPQPAEAPWLRVETRQGPDQRILKSREPLPDNPFPVMPLTAAQQARLTPMQHSRDQQQLAIDMFRRPRIDASQSTTVYVLEGKLSGVEGGGATPLWLHPDIPLGISCSNGPEKVKGHSSFSTFLCDYD
ncbi:hypothetical protein [Corallococcus sp. RDP092CA]|uniref:hypothetical protein n=1 Tax=Corallococcus sp. RDP092CA TaxID=3109369 RepID=UPI0035B0081E